MDVDVLSRHAGYAVPPRPRSLIEKASGLVALGAGAYAAVMVARWFSLRPEEPTEAVPKLEAST